MLPTFAAIHLVYLAIAIILEVVANVLLKMSCGFKYKLPAVAAILCVLAAFTALSFAIKGLHLSIAYAIWGGVGLIATALLGVTLFAERLRVSGWIGLVLLMLGVLLIKASN